MASLWRNQGFLPQNPSRSNQTGDEKPFPPRKISSKPRILLPDREISSASPVHNAPHHNSRVPLEYRRELHQKMLSAKQAQVKWYDNIAKEASHQHGLRNECLRLEREARYILIQNGTQSLEAIKLQQLDIIRARVRSLREDKWPDEERIRQEKAEAEDAILAQIYSEEEQRRQEEEEQRKQEEADRVRRERLRECTVCFDEDDMDTMIQLECMHWYCRPHLQAAFEVAWDSRTPFQCCQGIVSAGIASAWLSPNFCAQYELWLEERAEPNPIYCSDPLCDVYLPHRLADGPDVIRCNQCTRATCRHCRNAVHPGIECMADIDTQLARSLAASLGWKECPSCRNMVEKESGCLHMTCRCGTQFCYRCGRWYNICPGTCSA